ncbi:unnamed protein product [Spirodela intermedia]|uniref:Uncharacterized protein n=1 Tax=Spirodela intermedia TaxID=51605 RepID=A0A7I8ISM1_SPIIN|nr:unnamed protein product [Spirodela intermedia]CAA6660811.1 unnamed protein product [Spirodela intermedia]
MPSPERFKVRLPRPPAPTATRDSSPDAAERLRPRRPHAPFLLKSFTHETASLLGKELHAHALKFGLASNAFTQNALIHTYCLSGQVDAARAIFDRSLDRDVITWNAMISGYNRNKRYELSCKLFDEMKKVRLKPTWVTLLSALSACTKLKHLRAGERLHREMEEARLVPGNLVLENALIGMYAECGAIGAALKLFDGMKVRDVISWTSVIKGTPHRDLICWTAMTDGYVKANRFKEAWSCSAGCKRWGSSRTLHHRRGAHSVCHLGALEAGEWVRIYVGRRKVRADVAVGNAFIDMYSKCGVVERALEVFGGMERRDKFTWTVMIVGLAVNGRGEEALHLVTYVGVFQACVHSGLVDRGRRLFSGILRGAHGVAPQVAHYGCMVDLLGRAGRLREALEVINGMPMAPNSIVWGSLLGACRLHGDQEMAEMAAERLLELEPRDSAAYVLLADLYASAADGSRCGGEGEDPGEERDPRIRRRDATHLRSAEIMAMAEEMDRELRLAEYVPDMSESSGRCRYSEKLAVAWGLSSPPMMLRVVNSLRRMSHAPHGGSLFQGVSF